LIKREQQHLELAAYLSKAENIDHGGEATMTSELCSDHPGFARIIKNMFCLY
jgi:hypothetical protein